jgi:transmembrane sensor
MHPDDERLYLLLDRYLAGEASPTDAEAVRKWLAEDPEHARLLEDLRHITHVTRERVPESSAAVAWAKAVKALAVPARRPWMRRLLVAGLAAAAVLVALIGTAAVLLRPPRGSEYATTAAHRSVIRLRDGTRVTLGPTSRIRYAAGYGRAHRDVSLDGEAYFEVARDTRRPFRVHTAGSVTEDVGTAFAVRAYGGQNATEVVVAEGRVAVWRADTAGALVPRPAARPLLLLDARDMGRLDSRGLATLRRDVDVARYLAWTHGVLAFDGTPLSEVVFTLERWYNVEIHLADGSLATRRLTATFSNEPIDLVIKRIALTLGLRVERADGSVLLLRKAR